MADFCTICSIHMWGDKDDNLMPILPDIDVMAEFKKLEPDTYVSGLLCEGCGLVAIGNIKGELKVARMSDAKQEFIHWEDYTDKFI